MPFNQGRYTLFTLAATNAKPLEISLGNNIGNFQDMVADGVDPNLWYVQEIRYLGDSFTGIYPPIQTYMDGYNRLMTAINNTAGKFGFCAFSQGAGVCSMVAQEIWSPTGKLYHRRNDFVAATMFGNPSREAGHTIPNGIDPGGHGMMGPTHRNSGTPSYWWDFTNPEDPASTVGDDLIGQVIQGVSDQIAFGNVWNGTGNILAILQSIFFNEPEPFRDLIASALRYWQQIFDSMTILYPYDPVLNKEPHARYHFPYTNMTGNPLGLSAVQLAINYLNSIPGATTPPLHDYGVGHGSDPDRIRFIVEEAVTKKILTRDLVVKDPKILTVLSGAANIQFDVDYRDSSCSGIYFKPWGHWIHAEKLMPNGERRILASGIVVPSQIDKNTGMMHLEAQGFSAYAKGTPALFNWNPLAIDVFAVVHKLWDHIQSYQKGDMDVTVYPNISGIEMLPGYAFDGQLMNQNFYAMFIRATDKQDCADIIDKLSRDIPFDYLEQSEWNDDRSEVLKALYLGYPIAGQQQNQLMFVINENVIEAVPHTETEIDWASDILVDGWAPGTEFSAQISNADPVRYRRVISEDDAQINSNERAAAWAKKKLTRRQTPAYWESIIVDLGHPNAPLGTYGPGDRIMVRGYMPWVGDVNQMHKIIAMAIDEKVGACELTLKPEGMFTYDPIYYQGDVSGSTTIKVTNPAVVNILAGTPPTVGIGTPP